MLAERVGLPSTPPAVAPQRSPIDEAGLFADESMDNDGDDWTYHEEGSQVARAPP